MRGCRFSGRVLIPTRGLLTRPHPFFGGGGKPFLSKTQIAAGCRFSGGVLIPTRCLTRLPGYLFLDLYEESSFSIAYRRATASGTVSRVPGRSTCIGHTKDELRSPHDGRVMII